MVFTPPSVPPLAGDRNLRREEGNRPTRCSEPLRYKVGGASKPSPNCAGWDRQGTTCYNLLVETTIFVPHCSIALHLSSLEWGILFLFYFWEDYLWRGAHQGYGGVIHITCNHTIAFFTNCSEFPNSCWQHQFSEDLPICHILLKSVWAWKLRLAETAWHELSP